MTSRHATRGIGRRGRADLHRRTRGTARQRPGQPPAAVARKRKGARLARCRSSTCPESGDCPQEERVRMLPSSTIVNKWCIFGLHDDTINESTRSRFHADTIPHSTATHGTFLAGIPGDFLGHGPGATCRGRRDRSIYPITIPFDCKSHFPDHDPFAAATAGAAACPAGGLPITTAPSGTRVHENVTRSSVG
jgi:hypothetical protein